LRAKYLKEDVWQTVSHDKASPIVMERCHGSKNSAALIGKSAGNVHEIYPTVVNSLTGVPPVGG